MKRESWGSRTGFVLAAIGSAIGLANIISFPYMVGSNGGAAFILIYMLSLLCIGFPVFLAEAIIGRSAQLSPTGAFRKLGGSRFWTCSGTLIVCTGFVVSGFYSAVAAWIFGYLVEAVCGNLTDFASPFETKRYFDSLVSNPSWGVFFHGSFMVISASILYFGVRDGIERGSKIMMPALFLVLGYLVYTGLTLPGASQGLRFLFVPDWSAITPSVILLALGQSFFTLSAGQGTMITYGSYLSKKDNLITSCLPIALADTLISLMAAVAVFTIVFSAGAEPAEGLGLVFNTLPLVFSSLPGGYLIAVLFFSLVLLAAMTSQISAMEPVIAYFVDEWKWERRRAVLTVAIGAFCFGLPCALSTSVLSHITIGDKSILDAVIFVALDVLVPVGGLLAVVLVGWRWGISNAWKELEKGAQDQLDGSWMLRSYLRFFIKFGAPALILLVFLRALGIL